MPHPESAPQQYDVAVIGAGPAGVSAAINVNARGRSVVLLAGQAPFGRVNGPHEIANYAGFPATRGDALAAAFRRHLDELRIPVVPDKITRIGRDGTGLDDDGFVLFGVREAYRARTVVLATGVIVEASVEGEEELIGQGVSYCVTCDGRLFARRRVACVSYGPEGEEEAGELAEAFGVDVVYLPQYEGVHDLAPAVDLRAGCRPLRISREGDKVRVTLARADPGAEASAQGVEELEVDAVFISREAVAPGTLLDGLAVDGPHLVVDRYMCTSVPGVFAAGDCTGGPYQVAKAVGEGQVAALSAVRLLRAAAEAAAT